MRPEFHRVYVTADHVVALERNHPEDPWKVYFTIHPFGHSYAVHWEDELPADMPADAAKQVAVRQMVSEANDRLQADAERMEEEREEAERAAWIDERSHTAAEEGGVD